MKYKQAPVSLWDWLSLYATGLFLVVFMLAHVWLVHYVVPSPGGIRFDLIAERLRSPAFQVLDLGLLVLALYHGLAGVRRFVAQLDVVGRGGLAIITGALGVAGLAGLYYGWLIFAAFLK